MMFLEEATESNRLQLREQQGEMWMEKGQKTKYRLMIRRGAWLYSEAHKRSVEPAMKHVHLYQE